MTPKMRRGKASGTPPEPHQPRAPQSKPPAEARPLDDERFRIISELTSDFAYVFTVTPGGTLELEGITDAFTHITGYPPDEVWPAGNWLSLIHPDDQAFVQERLRYVLTGQDDRAEVRIVARDGTVRWLDIHTRAVWDQDQDQVVRVYGAVRDITKRKQAEAALRESEERYRTLAEMSPDAIYIIDRQGLVEYVNRAAAEMVGREPADIVGHPPGDSFAPGTFSRQAENLPKVFRSGQPLAVEDLNVIAGREIWQDSLLVPLKDKDGEVRAVMGISRDITARRRMEESLRESEERYRALVETSPDAITLTDLEGRILMANQRGAEIQGATDPAELVGMNVFDLVAPAEREKAVAHTQRALESGSVQGIEYNLLRRDGSSHPVELSASLLRDAEGQPQAFIGVTRDITERKQAEEVLWQTKMVVEHSPVILYQIRNEPGWPFDFVSENVKGSGYAATELLSGQTSFAMLVHPDDLAQVVSEMEEHAEHGPDAFRRSYRVVLKNGQVAWVEDRVVVVRAPDGQVTHFQGILLDVTENRKLEEQFRQSQKMETVGRLAGGIAHDFNNFLTAIRGYAGLAYDALQPGDPVQADVEQVLKAVERATSLTGQLLAFSRRQIIEPRPVNLNDLVMETEKMLRRLIGEDIDLVLDLTSGLGLVRADPSQITQSLVNLVINARDAMPDGGVLTIATANLTLDQEDTDAHAGVPAGSYVMLTVSDIGVGMGPEVKKHIFEPFFTTKDPGRGTGLGLATVYGIVRQHQGHITVQSEVGHGTTVQLYLPHSQERVRPSPSRHTVEAMPRGHETVLVVEDQPAVRALIVRILRSLGYQVLEANEGNAAIQVARAQKGKIHLLLTDVVMPQMDGKMLAGLLQDAYEGLRVLYVSGYATDVLARYGILDEGLFLLHKPFTGAELADKVREVLDQEGAPGEKV